MMPERPLTPELLVFEVIQQLQAQGHSTEESVLRALAFLQDALVFCVHSCFEPEAHRALLHRIHSEMLRTPLHPAIAAQLSTANQLARSICESLKTGK